MHSLQRTAINSSRWSDRISQMTRYCCSWQPVIHHWNNLQKQPGKIFDQEANSNLYSFATGRNMYQHRAINKKCSDGLRLLALLMDTLFSSPGCNAQTTNGLSAVSL